MRDEGQPMLPVQYCTRCCLPETQEGIEFDELGICQACQSSEQKMHIDWAARERQLAQILEEAAASSGTNYDCIVPISGGKDSTFQMHVLVNVYKVKPLAVTFNHNWYSKTGWYNLQNSLEKIGVDHIMFTPNRKLVNRIAKQSLIGIGDSCWHCHAGCGSFPLHVAVKFNIPLLVYGESLADSSGRATYDNPVHTYDREYFTKVSAKLRPDQMVSEDLSAKDLYPFELPSAAECERVGVRGIYIGDFLFWDDERQMEFVRDTYGWRETQLEGTYKGYKSAECIMPGMHDFTCYLKRGFGRGSVHASFDVRNGILSQEEGFALAAEHDPVRPEALDYFSKITGMSEQEIYEVMKTHRHERLKDTELPIKPKKKPNAERILPFTEQIIEEFED